MEQSLLNLTETNTIRYGKEVIGDRSLVDFRDGCKTIHRRILWAMYKMGMHHKGGFKKSARICGECFIEGTKILTEKGEVNIEDIKVGDTVTTTKGNGTVTEIYIMPPKETLNVTLVNGKNNICTKSQKFKVLDNDRIVWKQASDLKVGDKILCKK